MAMRQRIQTRLWQAAGPAVLESLGLVATSAPLSSSAPCRLLSSRPALCPAQVDPQLRSLPHTTPSVGFSAQAAVQQSEVDRFPVIRALWRAESGSKRSMKMRKEGLLPGALQGLPGNAKGWLTLNKKDISRAVSKIGKTQFCSRAWTLTVYTTPDESESPQTFHVVPRLVHRHAVTNDIENVVFFSVQKGSPVLLDVLVDVIGDDVSPGVKKGGFPFLLMRTVPLICPSDDIPEKIEVDVSSLDSEGRVLLKHITIPANCQIKAKNTHVPVVKIKGKARQLQPGEA